jgi:hypothetical protein
VGTDIDRERTDGMTIGREDILSSTDRRINRSVGGQGRGRMQYPDGMPIRRFIDEN